MHKVFLVHYLKYTSLPAALPPSPSLFLSLSCDLKKSSAHRILTDGKNIKPWGNVLSLFIIVSKEEALTSVGCCWVAMALISQAGMGFLKPA